MLQNHSTTFPLYLYYIKPNQPALTFEKSQTKLSRGFPDSGWDPNLCGITVLHQN